MGEKLNYLIGLMLADGGIYKYEYDYKTACKTLFVSDSSKEFTQAIAKLVNEIFKIKPGIWKSKSSKEIQVYSSRKEFVEFFQSNGMKLNKKTKEVKIPLKMKSGSREEIAAIIRGIFDGDGTIVFHKKDRNGKHYAVPCIKLKSMSDFLIKDIQELLKKLGIKSSAHFHKYGNDLYIMRKEDVSKFLDLVGFFHPLKAEKAKDILRIRL